jgi:RNA polymerase sigma-70 factor (ECF subfamily)
MAPPPGRLIAKEQRMNLPPSLAARPDLTTPGIPRGEDDSGDLVALVGRAKSGDHEAYTVLYHRYLAEVYRFALLRLDTREAAEDATQTIFLRALAALPACRENAAFVGWLFAIARSVVNDLLRARRHHTDVLPDEMEWEDSGPGPEQEVEANDTRRFLLAARESCLNARDRELFDLLLTELNDKQIAATLGRSHGAVRTAHSRLLSKLRKCLGPLTGAASLGGSHA